ncbi:MAG: PTS system nitrogen regulatory IIA component [Cellvibrionaceae bacterium]|jgi:PTS system nitrogen regulatory IIA component
MEIKSILDPECVIHQYECNSKKRLLETIASHLCDQNPALDPGNVFSALIARERLGSTGIGQGIAIPHCRIKGCSQTIGVMVSLKNPIDFDAIDGQPVDIIFVLIVPEDHNKDHLQTLATLAETFSDSSRLNDIRAAKDREELYNIIT